MSEHSEQFSVCDIRRRERVMVNARPIIHSVAISLNIGPDILSANKIASFL